MEGLFMKYFVLNPCKPNPYGKASRKALVAYAKSINKTNSLLSADILGWLEDIEEDLKNEK